MTKYAIVDLETTGTSASNGRITEVGIVLFDGEKVINSFESLVNPERSIPWEITRITGISNEMVRSAPKFYEIAKEIVEITKDAVFVAHNVGFDYGFLRKEFGALGFTFSRKKLCTVRLMRRVFPGFRSYSLGNLIERFDIQVKNRHRAMADALATTELLKLALKKESGDDEIATLINEGIQSSRLPKNITLEFLHSLPDETGVYYMHDMEGDVIYVGKALNIRKRIMQHFADKTTKGNLIHEYVADITWEITGSELVALLFESAEIKRLQPKLNRALRQKLLPFVVWSYTDDDGYICFDSGKITRAEAKKKKYKLLADFSKKANARERLKQAVEAHQLCLRLTGIERVQNPCFNYHIKKCYGACIQQEDADIYNERAEAAMEMLSRISTETFAIVDRGRTPDEKAIVLVEDGEYQGFGYVSVEQIHEFALRGQTLEDVQQVIKPEKHHQDSILIIRRWRLGGKSRIFPIGAKKQKNGQKQRD